MDAVCHAHARREHVEPSQPTWPLRQVAMAPILDEIEPPHLSCHTREIISRAEVDRKNFVVQFGRDFQIPGGKSQSLTSQLVFSPQAGYI
jgi:hypothetical protein